MKKWLCVLVVFMVFALCVPALANIGDETLLIIGDDQPIKNGIRKPALAGDTLYVYSYDNAIYSYDLKGERVWNKHDFSELITNDGENYIELSALTSYGNDLYAVLVEQSSADGESRVDGAYLYKLKIEGGAVEFQDELELDWYDMIESYDSYEYSRSIDGAFMQDDKLIFTTYGHSQTGQDLMAIDIDTGECQRYDIANLRGAYAYTPGSILLNAFNYSAEPRVFEFMQLDLDTEEVTPLAQLKMEGYYTPSGIVYDAAANTLYYALDGELFAMPDMDVSRIAAVAAVSANDMSVTPMLTSDGFYITYDYQSIIKRNTDPSSRAGTRLSVVNAYEQAFDNACREFEAAHDDVELVLRDYRDDIITAMMSRSTDTDVYSLSVDSADYSALFERGFLKELTGSEIISGFVKSMYPNLTDMLMRDGEVLALPTYIDSNCLSYNPKAFEAAGLTEQDVPKTWMEYLTLLKRMPELIDEDMNVTIMEPYYTVEDARRQLFSSLFNNYLLYISNGDRVDMGFDTPILRDLLAAFEEIDFTEFGLLENYEEENMRVIEYGDQNKAIFYSYGSVSPYTQRGDSNIPMPLSIADGEMPLIETYMNVVFVNPFSQNPELAIELLELLVTNLDEFTKIQASPLNNEPVRNPYYEESIKSYAETIDSLRKQLEAAEDSDKAYYETMIEEYEQYAEDFEKYGSWNADEQSIALYQSYAPLCAVNKNLGMDNEYYETFYAARQQYLEGEIDKETMLRNIDKKLKMMLLEGN